MYYSCHLYKHTIYNTYIILQNFIRACLRYKKEERPDVLQLSFHDYLKPSSLKSKG